MAYIGRKPSFSQVRTAELVVQRGTDISTAGTIAALDVSNISLVRLTAATVLQGIAAPSAPADNGKRVTLINANSSDLIVRNESATASASNRISTGISRDMRITPGASLTLTYNTASSRWSVESSSAEINIDRLRVASEVVSSGPDISVLNSGNGKSTLLELTSGFGSDVRSIAAGLSGQFVVLVNKTGSLIQVANEDVGATASDRILTGTGGPISLQNNASLFLAYLTDSTSASRWQVVGGTGSGGGATEQVTQTGIGNLTNFPVGTPLYVDATTGWTAANASAANTAEVAGMIGRSLSANLAEVVMAGEVAGVTASVFTEAVLPARGEVVFLSTTSGKLTITEPSVVGQISKPLGVVHNVNGSTSVDIMFFNWRGSVVGGANARTTISLANSATTSVQNVSAYDAGELAGWVFIDGTANTRFYIQAQFAKNGAGTDYNLSYQTTGDTPVAGFSMTVTAAGVIQVTLPSVAGFTSATINYALNAPAVGASLPLSVDSSALNIVAEAPLSYRNRIINGDMRIDQRNSGATVTNVNGYVVDRFSSNYFGAATGRFSGARSTVAPTGFTNSFLLTTTTAQASLGANDGFVIKHGIEGNNIADLNFGTPNNNTITLSFWVRSSLTGSFGVILLNDAANRTNGNLVTISSANTWEYKTVTVSVDTTGTWLSDNGLGLSIFFGLGAGSSRTVSTGWSTGLSGNNPAGVSGQTINLAGTAGATFYLTGVQLEVGSKASAFERRPYSEELARCLRYCRLSPQGIPVTTVANATIAFVAIPFEQPMRSTPVVTQRSTALFAIATGPGATADYNSTNSAIDLLVASASGISRIRLTGLGTSIPQNGYFSLVTADKFLIEAEL